MTDDAKDTAIHWMLRQRAGDMDEAEWEAFTLWLEKSESHVALLDEVQAAHDALGAGSADLTSSSAAMADGSEEQDEGAIPMAVNENDDTAVTQPANDNQLKRFLPFAGLAAAALAVVALWPSSAPSPVTITTEPGETRIVAISDEITMTLNGGTKVTLVEEETRVAVLAGEVAFDIDSDDPSPLRVEVGDLVLADYGTVFNVVLNASSVEVAVAEGAVGINPDKENVSVAAGQKITADLAGGSMVREAVDTDTVGTWAEGRLEFDNTPATEAVAMLERSIGSKVTLAEALQEETLTGSLIVSESERETVSQFAEFLGARARRGRLAGYGMVWDVR